IAAWALDKAKMEGKDVLIVDTSGRLHIDERLMEELKNIRKVVRPHAILLASIGEKLDQFEAFHPDRMAQRILGMGDVMSLIEKAERQFDEDEAKELERKIRKQQFTFDDFLAQMQQVRRMGPLTGLLKMLPGASSLGLSDLKVDDRDLDRLQA